MYRKKYSVYIGFGALSGFRHPVGSWNMSPTDKKGLLYFLKNGKLSLSSKGKLKGSDS